MCDTIRKGKFAIAGEAIQDKCKPFVPLDIAGTFEEFIQNGAYKIL